MIMRAIIIIISEESEFAREKNNAESNVILIVIEVWSIIGIFFLYFGFGFL